MPQKTGGTDANSGKRPAGHIPCDKKWMVFRCLIILAALSELYCERSWLNYYFNKTCEWLEPDFGNMMQYRHIIRFLCSLFAVLWAVKRRELSTHSLLGRKWKPGQTMLLSFFISQLAIFAMNIRYNIQWMYTFGWHRLYVSEIAVMMLLLPVWILFLLDILPPCCFIIVIILDWVFYYFSNLNHLGTEGIWINTYVDIVEKGMFAFLMILTVVGTRVANKRCNSVDTEI